MQKRLHKIDELSKTVDYGDLKFIISNSSTETNFSELKDSVGFLDSIRKCEISTEKVRHKQEEFNRYLKKVRIGNKSGKQKKTLANTNKLFNEKTVKKNLNQIQQKQKLNAKNIHLNCMENFLNEIKNDEKNIYEEILKKFFFHTILFLAKELYSSNQNESNEIVKHINDSLIEFKNILI